MKTPSKSIVTSLVGAAFLLAAVNAPAMAAATSATTPAIAAPSAAPAQKAQVQGVVFTPKTIQAKTAEYEAKISIPVISGLKDKAFETKLNAELQKLAQDSLKETQDMAKEDAATAKKYGYELRPHALDISYEVHMNGKLVSFAVQTYRYTGGAHGITDVVYYNLANVEKAKNLQLSDLFRPGYDYRYVLSHLIAQQIKADPDLSGIADGFPGVSENQSFAFENGKLVIHFGQYEIGPYAIGMPAFTIPTGNVFNLYNPEVAQLLK
ncbi:MULTISPECIES: DUF3298 and DUF4163 domain-containing protein [Brevibacillus]|jgi:hypothetical protein|uniref:DUF3298 and DUF4163 domain-containing protein n=1 Tax=Brevibacillus TaxID=55080 RepID=UPI0004F3E61E|nr:DUF3298 and DUF4163 domain-containing protein [Brevibacillus borstelensis]KKX54786.1 hypothetical protein X546_13300 [Brevibacillus borstelensis cifa_chp40]MBE5396132.1 DUF3298 and DUF4163 domain-containing protein [Brevibacillus borstelensis]MCC0563038.1 DUF3298 and DUF4163 domain-containing protein [Brevibacillus borstelensis]MCM3468980.1 DUF3298 and DUF4163 domain-containing protein [Brevibacillus borstelensis]MCM3558535.1 DUF3298 and DUF4163 domain-containing protein [Brevibacillus bors